MSKRCPICKTTMKVRPGQAGPVLVCPSATCPGDPFVFSYGRFIFGLPTQAPFTQPATMLLREIPEQGYRNNPRDD